VDITLNGKPVRQLALAPENNDLFHQFVLKNVDAKGANTVGIRVDGKGSLAYQVAGRYFVPWTENRSSDALSIDVAYDRTDFAQDDIPTPPASVRDNLERTANMVMVDLGIPPGFELLSEDLQRFQEKTAGQKDRKLEKFSLTSTQAILYFDSIAPVGVIRLNFRLRAKYPIRARTFQSRVSECYDPEVSSVAAPIQLEAQKRQ
jgi:alpha-2-macroglobulin-like protein